MVNIKRKCEEWLEKQGLDETENRDDRDYDEDFVDLEESKDDPTTKRKSQVGRKKKHHFN